ncbi:site-2 protease family protein [Candidatus Pacearchaeota archaeon]|nr:site-2 protease family protein [Candidatus Pacearchaeota archaeon]
MVSFWVYDVAFLILFSLGVFWFLRNRREELSREGIIFMWRTRFGINAIKWFAKKFARILRKMKWVVIGIGGILMVGMIWMLGQTVAIYLLHPEITKIIKAPPIAPLIPYFPKLFGMESFFPPFYFTYFIVALAIVAIVHEFSHGIFMRLFRIKIKSTGLVFLGPILGAFVEEKKSTFHKKKKSEQMTVLGAGVFANILMALLFYGLYVGFFFSSFTASGYEFNSYGIAVIPLENITGFSNNTQGLVKVTTTNGNYYLDEVLAVQQTQNNGEYLIAYSEAPAVLAGMRGAIIQADDVKITGQDSLREFMESKDPGDEARFVTEDSEGINEYDIVLGEHPEIAGRAYLGVGHNVMEPRGLIQKFLTKFMGFKESSSYYKPTWDGDFVYFVYHLLWWIMVINLLVALFNMMPLGMLDGGRFFYLAVLGIFGSEKVAKGAYKVATYLILLMFALMMFFWFVRIM